MPPDVRAALEAALVRDEDRRLKPYLDCCGKYWRECTCPVKGKLTIGVGRNLDDAGISIAESDDLLDNDIDARIRECATAFVWFPTLDPPRQSVLVQMAFNLGIGGLKQFPLMLAAVARGDFAAAAMQMRQSRWATEVGARATRLALEMQTGVVA